MKVIFFLIQVVEFFFIHPIPFINIFDLSEIHLPL